MARETALLRSSSEAEWKAGSRGLPVAWLVTWKVVLLSEEREEPMKECPVRFIVMVDFEC